MSDKSPVPEKKPESAAVAEEEDPNKSTKSHKSNNTKTSNSAKKSRASVAQIEDSDDTDDKLDEEEEQDEDAYDVDVEKMPESKMEADFEKKFLKNSRAKNCLFSLRTRTVTALLLSFLAMIVIISLFQFIILSFSYNSIDTSGIKTSASRTFSGIYSNFEYLHSNGILYAAWDANFDVRRES